MRRLEALTLLPGLLLVVAGCGSDQGGDRQSRDESETRGSGAPAASQCPFVVDFGGGRYTENGYTGDLEVRPGRVLGEAINLDCDESVAPSPRPDRTYAVRAIRGVDPSQGIWIRGMLMGPEEFPSS